MTVVEVQPHDCPKCSERTAGGMDDHCMSCGWRPGMILDNATITVKEAVDGTKKRRKPGPRGPKKAITTTLSMDDVLPVIAAKARAVRKPGQVFVVVSPDCVRVVNR